MNVRWTPRGIDRRQIGLGAPDIAADGENFLFEDGRIFQRNGLISTALTGIAAGYQIVYANSLAIGGVPKSYFVAHNGAVNKLYSNNGVTATEITAATANIIGSGGVGTWSMAAFLGALYVGNPTGGIFNADVTAGTYTRVSTTGYKYLTSHLSRLVGAHTAATANGARQIGWTITGSGDDWAGVGSGTNTLADVEDSIEGLYNIHNQVAILRSTGLHMGYPTGVAIPAYRFEEVASDIDPVMGGQCAYGNELYYMGKSNVYVFDGNNFKPFGSQVIADLMYYVRSTACYFVGFVSDGGGEATTTNRRPARSRYHLVPVRYGFATTGVPHYVYDFEEQVWSKHTYSAKEFAWAFDFQTGSVANSAGPAMFDYTTKGTMHRWHDTAICEKSAFVESAVLLVGEDESDYISNRALLMYRDVGATTLTFELKTMLNDTETTYTKSLSVGSVGATEKMIRKWIDDRLIGNGFRLKITCPANEKCDLTFATALFDTAGGYRG